uniref:SCAN box domain-containing protein n=1 Tax=Lynx canadensis TaxID=61383 RepID=A0A667IT59_LYNCA
MRASGYDDGGAHDDAPLCSLELGGRDCSAHGHSAGRAEPGSEPIVSQDRDPNVHSLGTCCVQDTGRHSPQAPSPAGPPPSKIGETEAQRDAAPHCRSLGSWGCPLTATVGGWEEAAVSSIAGPALTALTSPPPQARCPCGARDPMGGPVSPAREAGRPGCRGPGPGLTVAPLPPLPPGRRARAPARALGLLRRAVPGMAAARGAHQGAEMELLVLEQFLSALPQTSRPGCASRGPKSGEDAVDMLEEIWGPAMRAPQDVTEGSGVAVGKEDGVMMPLGE